MLCVLCYTNLVKILVFTETYLPTVNGVVDSIELFRHELESRDHEVDIVTPHSDQESFKARRHVFRLPSFPIIGQPSHPLAYLNSRHVESIYQEVKADLVHVQGLFATGFLGRRLARAHHLPHVLTYHTHLEAYAHYAGPLAFIIKPVLRMWTRWFANGFDVVITPSPSMAKILKKYGVKTDVVALPTGIDMKLYAPAEKVSLRKQLEFDPDTIYILFVGRLASEKNVTQVLADFGRLHVRQPHIQLLLAGDGPDRRAYEAIVKARGLSQYVTFLGSVPHLELINYFVACDIFAFPSLTDTEGIVLIEAMASGTPSVVYDALGPGDIITHGENGLKAKPGTDQFFQHLFSLVEDAPLREKLSLGALREVRKYSIEKTTDQLEQVYTVLVDPKSAEGK